MPPRGKKSAPKTFIGNAPKISYEMSFTKNLGDYESLRVSAKIDIDADFDDDDLVLATEKMEIIREKLKERLLDDIDLITED